MSAAAPVLDATQRRLVRGETAIATVLCSLLPTLLAAFLFEPFPVPVQGPDGLVAFALKSTLVAVAMMTLLMTLGTRAKVDKGAVAPLARDAVAVLTWVPRALIGRVLLFALAAALLLAAATAALASMLDLAPLERPAFVVFNLLIGALIGLLMTPLIQCAALADRVAAGADAGATAA